MTSMRARSACRCIACLAEQYAIRVPILRILAIKTPPEMAAAARKLVDRGYRYLKIKVHGHVAEDVARVAAIRREVGDDVHLTIDANQSYSPKDAVAALNRMAEYRIDLCRAAGHRRGFCRAGAGHAVGAGHGRGRRRRGLAARDFRARSKRSVDAVSLKIPKLGGLRNTLAAARLCEAAHIKHRLGAAVGTGFSRRRRCISPARCRASITPASSANSTGCSTIRSRVSPSRMA